MDPVTTIIDAIVAALSSRSCSWSHGYSQDSSHDGYNKLKDLLTNKYGEGGDALTPV